MPGATPAGGGTFVHIASVGKSLNCSWNVPKEPDWICTTTFVPLIMLTPSSPAVVKAGWSIPRSATTRNGSQRIGVVELFGSTAT